MSLRRSASLVLALALAVSAAAPALAQDQTQQANRGTIAGVVRTPEGAPLGQVSVRVVGTSLGATTNAEGQFVIPNVNQGVYSLETRRVGFAPGLKTDVRVTANARTEVQITVTDQPLILSSVVSTGLSDPTEGAKRPFSVAKLTSEQMPVTSTGSPLLSLAGRVAGVTVRSGGAPGSDVVIQLRNPTSFRSNTQPLIIIDGIIQMQNDNTISGRGFSGSPLDINPEDIADIEIVRGAAAAALYGQKAANGVINIRTNRGSDLAFGQTRLTVSTEAGMSRLGTTPEFSTHHRYNVDENNQFVDLFGRPVTDRSFANDPNSIIDNTWGVPVYNHVNEMFRTGSTLISSATLSQQTVSTNFNVNTGSSNETGVLRAPRGGTSQNNLRMNLDHRAGDKMQVSLGLFYNRRFQRQIATGNGLFENMLDIRPDVSLLARDPSTGDYYPFPDEVDNDLANPLFFEPKRDEWEKRAGMQASSELIYRPTSLLSLSGQFGYQRSDREQQDQWIPAGALEDDGGLSAGEYDIGADLDETFNGQLRAQLLAPFGGLTVRGFIAANGQVQKLRGWALRGDTVFQSGKDIDFTRRQQADQTVRDVNTLSYSANVAFEYEQRYIADILYRQDGSSLLPPETRWRDNGRVSLAWSMAEELWWPLTSVPFFKLRYSIGTAGNNPLFSDRYETYLQNNGTERIFKQNMGNTEIVPEEVTEHELGVEFSLWNKFGFELTYARQDTRNAIRADTILSYTGFDTQVSNLGDLRGETYEATVEANWISTRDVRWSTTLVADQSREKITSYPRLCGNANTGSLQRECEGYVFGQMYGSPLVRDVSMLSPRHHDNGTLDQFDRNDDGLIVAVGPNGSWTDRRWGQNVSIDGITYAWGMPIVAGAYNDDGLRTGDLVVNLGQGLPKFQFGLGNQLQYKRWNLHVQLNGQVGGLIYNRTKQNYYNLEVHGDVDQFGKPDYAKKPVTYYTGSRSTSSGAGGLTTNSNTRVLDWFVEDGDYLKIGELQVRYRLDGQLPLVSKIGVTAGSLALTARNLYTFTGYTGFTPEIGGSTTRVDTQGYPQYRNFTLQLRLVF